MPPDIIGTLEDILEAATYIEADTAGMTFEAFEADRRSRQAVERNFEIIGEAINRLRRHAPDIAARIGSSNQAVALGNALIHGYDGINDAALWIAVQESLPVLRAEVEALLREAEGR
jgi:uncharacterized protein with HEPN domain